MSIWGTGIRVTKGGLSPQESPDGRDLYYLKRESETRNSLWKLPLGGGDEARVLESVLHDDYAIGNHGIYFILDANPFAVQFLGFNTHKNRHHCETIAPARCGILSFS